MTSLLWAFVAVAVVGVQSAPTVLQRFLGRTEEAPVEYRALRHLEASNPHFHQSAWMEVWTEFDRVNGLRYAVVSEGGSPYIRQHVLLAALNGEQKIWANREPQRASFTHENYFFEDSPADDAGVTSLGLKPRRKDVLLVEGSLIVQARDGDL